MRDALQGPGDGSARHVETVDGRVDRRVDIDAGEHRGERVVGTLLGEPYSHVLERDIVRDKEDVRLQGSQRLKGLGSALLNLLRACEGDPGVHLEGL